MANNGQVNSLVNRHSQRSKLIQGRDKDSQMKCPFFNHSSWLVVMFHLSSTIDCISDCGIYFRSHNCTSRMFDKLNSNSSQLFKFQCYTMIMNSHWTVTLAFLVALPTLLLAEHSYNPVSSLLALVNVKFTLTLDAFPHPTRTLILSLTDTLSLEIPLHTIVGGG